MEREEVPVFAHQILCPYPFRIGRDKGIPRFQSTSLVSFNTLERNSRILIHNDTQFLEQQMEPPHIFMGKVAGNLLHDGSNDPDGHTSRDYPLYQADRRKISRDTKSTYVLVGIKNDEQTFLPNTPPVAA